ncbi:MAG: hypothetical protein WKF58_09800 [Ilumatobacteraceae bacterium]
MSRCSTAPGSTKRALVDYLDAVRDRLVPVLRDRPLSVIRGTGKQRPFMQKNLPKYTPDWVERVTMWAEASRPRRQLRALRRPSDAAVVRQPARCRVPPHARAGRPARPSDPHGARPRPAARATASQRAVAARPARARCARATSGSAARSRRAGPRACTCSSRWRMRVDADGNGRSDSRDRPTSGADSTPTWPRRRSLKADRGGKVFVDATRAGGATMVAAYSPRAGRASRCRIPVRWDELDDVRPDRLHDHERAGAARRARPVGRRDAAAQTLPAELVEPRAARSRSPESQAMHEGKRRRREAATD